MPDQLTEQMEGIRKQLETRWRIEAEALNKSWFSNQGQFDTALAKLNSKYQQEELKVFSEIQQQEESRQRVQELIAGPKEYGRAEEADIRLELGPEAERLVFPQQQDPQLAHQRNLAEQNRVLDTVDAFVIEGGKLYQAKLDDKGYYTDKADRSKPATQDEIQLWSMSSQALSALEQEEQNILGQLSDAGMPDPVYLQSLYTKERRKSWWGRMQEKVLVGTPYHMKKAAFAPEPKGTFAQKVGQTLPQQPQRRQPQRKLTKSIAMKYLMQYGNKQDAIAAARADGYIE